MLGDMVISPSLMMIKHLIQRMADTLPAMYTVMRIDGTELVPLTEEEIQTARGHR